MAQIAPVALIIFNRPETTAKVFEAIRQFRPSQLFVIADGPRPQVQGDAGRCAAARNIVEQVDWPCEVRRLYADTNLGCGQRPATGISWLFEQVDRAIILEDDCLPSTSFFRYCVELLDRYENDPRIMHISGNNRGHKASVPDNSYYFSRIAYCWGWATWQRAWRFYNYDLDGFNAEFNEYVLRRVMLDEKSVKYWLRIFSEMKRKHHNDIWDFQWNYACWKNTGYSIVPNYNLVSNIGFGTNATHTTENHSMHARMKSSNISFPLRHPRLITTDDRADKRAFSEIENRFSWRVASCLSKLRLRRQGASL